MNLSCFIYGHKFEKQRETFQEDLKEGFYASNLGTSVTYYGYDVYVCSKCGKEKLIYNGKKEVR